MLYTPSQCLPLTAYSRLGAQRCVSIRHGLTHLRRWFLEDCRQRRASSKTTTTTADAGPPEDQLISQTWDNRDVTVARWLATQLDHQPLVSALADLQDLQLNAQDSIWRLMDDGDDENTKDEGAPLTPLAPSPPSLLLPRLEELTKERIVSHIRR